MRMSEPNPFEIEDDPPEAPEPATVAPDPEARAEPSAAFEHPLVVRRSDVEPEGLLAVLDARRRKRLARFVPAMGITFLIVGWLLVGGAFWVFGLVGAAIGAFAAWRRRSEVVLGTLSAIAGLATSIAIGGVIGGVSGTLTIVACGAIGFLAGLDDRLRGG